MTYGAFLIRHPLFWAALTGASLGAALATATASVRRSRRPSRARSRKWTWASLLATGAVVAATCGIFVAGGTEFARLPSLYVGIGTLMFCGAALRFPRAGGIPALAIIGLLTLVSSVIMHPFIPVRGETVIADVHLISADEARAYVEITDYGPASSGLPRIEQVPGETLTVRARLLTISDYLFFLGATEGAVLDGLGNGAGTPPDLYPSMPVIGRVVDFVPLLKLQSATIEDVRPLLLRRYDIVAIPRGGIEMRERTTRE